jgi:hypothetical protein
MKYVAAMPTPVKKEYDLKDGKTCFKNGIRLFWRLNNGIVFHKKYYLAA